MSKFVRISEKEQRIVEAGIINELIDKLLGKVSVREIPELLKNIATRDPSKLEDPTFRALKDLVEKNNGINPSRNTVIRDQLGGNINKTTGEFENYSVNRALDKSVTDPKFGKLGTAINRLLVGTRNSEYILKSPIRGFTMPVTGEPVEMTFENFIKMQPGTYELADQAAKDTFKNSLDAVLDDVVRFNGKGELTTKIFKYTEAIGATLLLSAGAMSLNYGNKSTNEMQDEFGLANPKPPVTMSTPGNPQYNSADDYITPKGYTGKIQQGPVPAADDFSGMQGDWAKRKINNSEKSKFVKISQEQDISQEQAPEQNDRQLKFQELQKGIEQENVPSADDIMSFIRRIRSTTPNQNEAMNIILAELNRFTPIYDSISKTFDELGVK
jgi:hypothetical protein